MNLSCKVACEQFYQCKFTHCQVSQDAYIMTEDKFEQTCLLSLCDFSKTPFGQSAQLRHDLFSRAVCFMLSVHSCRITQESRARADTLHVPLDLLVPVSLHCLPDRQKLLFFVERHVRVWHMLPHRSCWSEVRQPCTEWCRLETGADTVSAVYSCTQLLA